MQIRLLEPPCGGRVSGGYLYNQKLSVARATLSLHAGAPANLVAALVGTVLGPDTLLLVDSLFLNPADLAPLFELRGTTRCRLGCLVHALPSFIQRAHLPPEAFGAQPWRPSETELELLGRFDVVVAPGPFIPGLLESANAGTPCIECLPGCERRAPSGRTAVHRPSRILTVATLAPNKGHLDALAALTQLGDTDWRWRIVGDLDTDPEFTAKLHRALAQSGLAPRVEFAGAQPSDAIWTELAAADVLLHASYTENQPLIVMESLAAAVPVVGYRVGGMRGLVDGNGAGALAPLRDTQALAAALRGLLEDEQRYGQASRAALDGARGWTSWTERAAQLCHDIDALFGAG